MERGSASWSCGLSAGIILGEVVVGRFGLQETAGKMVLVGAAVVARCLEDGLCSGPALAAGRGGGALHSPLNRGALSHLG